MNSSSTPLNNRNPENGKSGFYYGWVVLIACFLIALAAITVRNSFGVFFKSIETAFDINRAATSGLMSVSQLVGCIVCVVNGWALDRYGPKKVLIAAGILTGAGMLLTSRAGSVWQLYVTYGILVALGAGGINTIIMTTASRWFTRRRSLALAIVTSSFSVGMLFATGISCLIVNVGWQQAFLILALITIGLWIPSVILIKSGGKDNTNNSPSNQRSIKSENEHYTFARVVGNNQFWICLVIWFIHGFSHLMVQTHIVPKAIDLKIDPVQAATVLGVMGIANLAGRLSMARVADIWNKKGTVVVCTLLIGAAMLWLPWTASLWHLYIFAVVFEFGFGGMVPAVTSTIADIFGLNRLGTIMGSLDAIFGVGAALGPALAGYLFDLQGNYITGFLIGFAAIAISLGMVSMLKPVQNSSAAK